MMPRAVAGVLVMLALAGAAAAAEKPDPCGGSANDAALRTCRDTNHKASERRLRETYDQLHTRHRKDEPKLADLLAAAQKAWRSFRDVECRVRTYESASGTMYDTYLLACLTELNEDRAKGLQAMIDEP